MSIVKLEIIERYHQFVSTETVQPFSPAQPFTQRLREMFYGTKEFVTQQFAGIIGSSSKAIDLSKLISIAESQDYAGMSRVPVMQPLRLNKSWDEYALMLQKLQDVTDGIEKNLLVPFNNFVGKGLNNPQLFNSLQFKPDGYRFVDTKPLKAELGKFLSGPNRDQSTWGKAFRRQKDVNTFAEIMNGILLNHAKTSPEAVKKATDAVIENCTALMEEIKNPTSSYVLNKKTATALSELILQVAQHIELYTITHNLIVELEKCALTTQDSLKINGK